MQTVATFVQLSHKKESTYNQKNVAHKNDSWHSCDIRRSVAHNYEKKSMRKKLQKNDKLYVLLYSQHFEKQWISLLLQTSQDDVIQKYWHGNHTKKCSQKGFLTQLWHQKICRTQL
jgi:hypothetical protein